MLRRSILRSFSLKKIPLWLIWATVSAYIYTCGPKWCWICLSAGCREKYPCTASEDGRKDCTQATYHNGGKYNSESFRNTFGRPLTVYSFAQPSLVTVSSQYNNRFDRANDLLSSFINNPVGASYSYTQVQTCTFRRMNNFFFLPSQKSLLYVAAPMWYLWMGSVRTSK